MKRSRSPLLSDDAGAVAAAGAAAGTAATAGVDSSAVAILIANEALGGTAGTMYHGWRTGVDRAFEMSQDGLGRNKCEERKTGRHGEIL